MVCNNVYVVCKRSNGKMQTTNSKIGVKATKMYVWERRRKGVKGKRERNAVTNENGTNKRMECNQRVGKINNHNREELQLKEPVVV